MELDALVYTEHEVMEMFGVKSRNTLAKMRERGLVGHKVTERRWVYLADDIRDYIRTCDCF